MVLCIVDLLWKVLYVCNGFAGDPRGPLGTEVAQVTLWQS